MNTTVKRYTLGLVMATPATLGLLFVMQALIANDELPPEEVKPPVRLSFSREVTDVTPEPPEDKVKPPIKPELQPPSPPKPMVEGGGFVVEKVTPNDPTPRFTPRARQYSDGSAVPLMAVSPNYPQRARQRGQEGYVVIEFGITTNGKVVNPTVVDAQPSGVFDRAAIDAIRRYKYKPSVIDGQPVPVTGVLHRITFQLEG